MALSFRTKLVGKRISGAFECKPAEFWEASAREVALKDLSFLELQSFLQALNKCSSTMEIITEFTNFQAWLIDMTSTIHLTCALKAPSSRGGGGGKFPGLDGRAPGSSRGGGGGGRKSPTERTWTQEVNIQAITQDSWKSHICSSWPHGYRPFCLFKQLSPMIALCSFISSLTFEKNEDQIWYLEVT